MKPMKTTTAIALCISIATPGPVLSQSAATGFPCTGPAGNLVRNENQLSKSLSAFLTDAEPEAESDAAPVDNAPVCAADMLATLLDNPDKRLQAAINEAPEERRSALVSLIEAGVGSEDATETDVTPETGADPSEDASDDTAADAEATVADAGDTTAGTSEPAVAPADAAPAEDTARASVDPDTAETSEAADRDQADEIAPAAGEAGGTTLTDEERQARAQARQAAKASAPAAVGTEDSASDEDAVQVETRTVSEEEVRSSSEEFETGATGQEKTSDEKGRDGVSDFEKALLLGLGAAIVGSILNNGDEVVSNSGDRVVVERDGELKVLKDDDELLRRPGAEVRTQTFEDGSTRTEVTYEDGSRIITVRSPEGLVLRRSLIRASDGKEIVLVDDTRPVDPIDFDSLPKTADNAGRSETEDELRTELRRARPADLDRNFSLWQVREYKRVRALAPMVELDSLTFDTGSAAIEPEQVDALARLGSAIRDIVEDDPAAVFLVEGHTDAVGSAAYNLALSDRRAESVALALTEYFDVPPQNLIVQGYGESDLKVRVLSAERANRRAIVRNITDLLR